VEHVKGKKIVTDVRETVDSIDEDRYLTGKLRDCFL
jgi:hypothetical protein